MNSNTGSVQVSQEKSKVLEKFSTSVEAGSHDRCSSQVKGKRGVEGGGVCVCVGRHVYFP